MLRVLKERKITMRSERKRMRCPTLYWCLAQPWVSLYKLKQPWVSLWCLAQPWVSLCRLTQPWVSLWCLAQPWVSLCRLKQPWVSLWCLAQPWVSFLQASTNMSQPLMSITTMSLLFKMLMSRSRFGFWKILFSASTSLDFERFRWRQLASTTSILLQTLMWHWRDINVTLMWRQRFVLKDLPSGVELKEFPVRQPGG